MPKKKKFKPVDDVVNQWPEIFEDLYMNSMPVDYLHCVILEFNDGRIWEIEVSNHLEDCDHDSVAQKLTETIKEFQEEIKKIDFRIDIDRLKRDVISSTNKFFK